MHDDGNIRYANYQSESQMTDYLTTNGLSDSISEIISWTKLRVKIRTNKVLHKIICNL